MNRPVRDPRLTVAAGACELAGARRFAAAIRCGMAPNEVLAGMRVLLEVALRDELAIHEAIGVEAPFASPERDQRESLR